MMTSLKERLGEIEWGGSNYNICLKDMELSHLANCQLLCARKVREFAELGVDPCEYRGIFHYEWQVLFAAQRVVTEDKFHWTPELKQQLKVVLDGIAVRNLGKLKVAAQKAADEAYARTMEAQQRRHTNRTYFDPEEMRSYCGDY